MDRFGQVPALLVIRGWPTIERLRGGFRGSQTLTRSGLPSSLGQNRCTWRLSARSGDFPDPRDTLRVEYEYERNGTASIFMFCEPHAQWRQATARPQRAKTDWATEVAALLDGRYAACERVTLVCDNLNTHTPGAFYESFPPEQARRYVWRLEFCHTPAHGR